MTKNINDIERVLRIGAGTALASLAVIGPKKPLFLLFAIPAIEGLIGKCTLYSALGISTRKDSFERLTTEQQANVYYPVQSVSERAAGHPLVGAS